MLLEKITKVVFTGYTADGRVLEVKEMYEGCLVAIRIYLADRVVHDYCCEGITCLKDLEPIKNEIELLAGAMLRTDAKSLTSWEL